MNPAIVAPDGFDIIDMSAGGQLHQDQRRNLGSVAKMLQHAAANKLFEGENAHMTPMNNYISQTYEKFRYERCNTDQTNYAVTKTVTLKTVFSAGLRLLRVTLP